MTPTCTNDPNASWCLVPGDDIPGDNIPGGNIPGGNIGRGKVFGGKVFGGKVFRGKFDGDELPEGEVPGLGQRKYHSHQTDGRHSNPCKSKRRGNKNNN